MGNRLSYSQVRLYQECGQKYKYYYVDKIRERTKSGALFFGSAIDKTFEALVKNPSIDADAVFEEVWAHQEFNVRGKSEYLPDNLKIVYAQSDMDFDLLTLEDARFLSAKHQELVPEISGCFEDAYAECVKFKKQRAFRKIRDNELKFLNLCNWFSLRRKGLLMVKTFKEQILPKITKVISTQSKVELNNSEGDSLIGYADLVCHWDNSEAPVIIDFKTSSMEYDADSVSISPQLTIYAHALNIKRAGFIVFRKGILKNKSKTCSICGFDGTGSRAKTCTKEAAGKRCGGSWNESIKPEVDVQIIFDDIPEQTENIVLQNVEEVNKAIDHEVFIRNFGSCKTGYGLCPYVSLCFRNVMSDELEKL